MCQNTCNVPECKSQCGYSLIHEAGTEVCRCAHHIQNPPLPKYCEWSMWEMSDGSVVSTHKYDGHTYISRWFPQEQIAP